MSRVAVATIAVAAAIQLLSARLSAQSASAFVLIDDWTMPYIEHLIQAGVLTDPDPLTRPFRRADLHAALVQADTQRATPAVRATVRRLREHFRPAGSPAYRADLYLGGSGGTHARRDPLREAGSRVGAGHGGAELNAVFGPFVLATRPLFDGRLRRDPDYKGKVDDQIPISGRIADAYLSVQGRYGQLTFGTLQRNWGPPGIDGVMVSSAPYGYDHLTIRLGTPSLRIETLVTQLDDMLTPANETIRRGWASHRLVIHPIKGLWLTIAQGTLWHGVGRGLEFHWLNPLRLSAITRVNEDLPDSLNSLQGLDLRIALPRGLVFQGTLLVDDLADVPVLGTSLAPNRIAMTAVLDAPITPGFAARLLYTLVTNLAYRAPQGPRESVMLDGVGLGRNFADYTQLTLSGSMMPTPLVVLTPEITVLRQGEGDFRLPWPASYAGVPTLFAGTTERTVRVGLGGRIQMVRHLDADANAGLHFVANRGHVAGASATRFVGRLALSYRFGGSFQLP